MEVPTNIREHLCRSDRCQPARVSVMFFLTRLSSIPRLGRRLAKTCFCIFDLQRISCMPWLSRCPVKLWYCVFAPRIDKLFPSRSVFLLPIYRTSMRQIEADRNTFKNFDCPIQRCATEQSKPNQSKQMQLDSAVCRSHHLCAVCVNGVMHATD